MAIWVRFPSRDIVVTLVGKPTAQHQTPPSTVASLVPGSSFSPRGSRNPAIVTTPNDGGEDNSDGHPHNNPNQPPAERPTNETNQSRSNKKRRRPRKRGKGKNTRATIKIATLNMRGRTLTNDPLGPGGKWYRMNQTIKEKKIGILAVQGAHLNDDLVEELHNKYRRLKIIYSQGSNENAAGVAFVINKDITVHENITAHEIIPGRALQISTPWHNNLQIKIMNVYAPNNQSASSDLWKNLQQKFQNNEFPKPDLMLGDFNFVEDSIDRLPCHHDNPNTIESMSNLRNTLNLEDGWRTTFPTEKAYTHTTEPAKSRGRLDRIYASPSVINTATDWDIEPTVIGTDHDLVSVKISNDSIPFIDKGRWTMPLFLTKDKSFKETALKLGIKLYNDIKAIETRSDSNNAQILFKIFKNEIAAAAKTKAKQSIPKITKTMEHLKENYEEIINDKNRSENERINTGGLIRQRIYELERLRFNKARQSTKTHNALAGETIGRYWSNLNKKNTPREFIYQLKDPHSNPIAYESDSKKMAEIARRHHEDLLTADIHEPAPERENTIKQVHDKILPESCLPEHEKIKMSQPIDNHLVEISLQDSANNTSAGINGIPYEFWKAMATMKTINAEEPSESFDIIDILSLVYRDVETHGVHKDSEFTLGWMCPLYKKNDRRDISNYRPITCLNSDYKIYTKALSLKLAEVAHLMIHENQAGFMPGRSIFDQVQLAKMMISYAEITEENGMIVCLDQEKAYDKICHDYLWRTLKKYNLPDHFINTVKSLYEAANTAIILNGVVSKTFDVSRGVRQGCPLSCLLFNIAIEPLANLLRLSNKLSGYRLPGALEKLITTLFADDTTVYLSEEDTYDDLLEVLQLWCKASGAKFNEKKTEFIPVGTPDFRKNTHLNRTHNPLSQQLETTVNIAKEGEPIRVLGAWIGNGVNDDAVWSKNVEKIRETLDRWNKGHPTIIGRRLIVQTIVGGITQYMTAVQGMPPQIEETIQKLINEFVWNTPKASRLNKPTQSAPISEGGLKLLDLKARNQAIDLMWLKGYLNLSDKRPIWANVADTIILKCIAKSNNIDTNLTTNMFLQSWKPNTLAPSQLPGTLKRMIKTGQEYGTRFSALHVSEETKSSLAAFYHFGANPIENFNRTDAAKCLKTIHQIKTITDIATITKRLRRINPNDEHFAYSECTCTDCSYDRDLSCKNPHRCSEAANLIIRSLKPKYRPTSGPLNHDRLSLTPDRELQNETAKKENKALIFNPSIQHNGNLASYFRVFTEKNTESDTPAKRPTTNNEEQNAEEAITVYTDGSYQTLPNGEASTGSGIWFGENDPRNKSLKVPTENHSNQIGELAAVLWAVKNVDKTKKLNIISDSKYVITGLTEHLPRWEATGYIGTANKNLFRTTAAALRERAAQTTFRWIKGHSGDKGNDGADKLADTGAKKNKDDILDLEISPRFNLTGAELKSMTQALLYKGICELKLRKWKETSKWRKGTAIMLDITRHAVLSTSGKLPSDKDIWTSLRHKDFARPFRTFLWKTAHNLHKIGQFWENIEGHEHKGLCHDCDSNPIDNLDHILLECETPGAKIIWELAKQLWTKKYHNWPELTNAGNILGCGLSAFKTDENKPDTYKNRMYRIIISESTKLIWTLRNERLFGQTNTPPSHRTIHNKWIRTMNDRLTLDRTSTHSKYEKLTINKSLVIGTWTGFLEAENDLPKDWLKTNGVLVGMAPMERLRQVQQIEDPP